MVQPEAPGYCTIAVMFAVKLHFSVHPWVHLARCNLQLAHQGTWITWHVLFAAVIAMYYAVYWCMPSEQHCWQQVTGLDQSNVAWFLQVYMENGYGPWRYRPHCSRL